MINVTGLRSLTIETNVFDESVDFYSKIWNLTRLPIDSDGQVFFRGTGPESYILSVKRGDRPCLSKVTLALPDRQAVDHAAGAYVGVLRQHLAGYQQTDGYGKTSDDHRGSPRCCWRELDGLAHGLMHQFRCAANVAWRPDMIKAPAATRDAVDSAPVLRRAGCGRQST